MIATLCVLFGVRLSQNSVRTMRMVYKERHDQSRLVMDSQARQIRKQMKKIRILDTAHRKGGSARMGRRDGLVRV